MKWVALTFLFIFALGLFIPESGRTEWLFELPYHLIAGCVLHAKRALAHFASDLPKLMTAAVLPCLATAIALWGAHRLILWWRLASGKDKGWHFKLTALAGSLVLLGSAAAIALSGVLHEAAWLPQGEITRSNGRSAQTVAVNNARQLGIMLFEHETEHGAFPMSLLQLEELVEDPQTLRRMMLVDLGSQRPPEPFVLVKPGGVAAGNPTEIVLIGPQMLEDGKFVVLRLDNSVTSQPAAKFIEVVKSATGTVPNGK